MKTTVMVLGAMACLGLMAGAETNFTEVLDAGTREMKARYPDFAAARADFSNALQLARSDTQKAQAVAGIANTFYRGREHDKGRATDAQLLNMAGSTARQKIEAQLRIAESSMGYRFPEKPDYARARVEYAKVLEMAGVTPGDKAKAISGVGVALAVEKKYAEARAMHARIVSMEGVNPELRIEAQYNIASVFRAEGNFEMARAEYGKILRMEKLTPEYREKVEERIASIYR